MAVDGLPAVCGKQTNMLLARLRHWGAGWCTTFRSSWPTGSAVGWLGDRLRLGGPTAALDTGLLHYDEAAPGGRNRMVNACRFPAKTGGPARPTSRVSVNTTKDGQFREVPKTAKNIGKQRDIPLFLRRTILRKSRISAAESGSVAVNFWEEQRKQR